MKQLLFLVLGFFSLSTGAQVLDTIYANENHNTALFFPAKVRQGIVGSENFIFSYSEEKPRYFGLIKAVPGTTSNLLVLTEDGQIYSYVLSYKEELSSFNYFIDSEKSIGNEKPTVKIPFSGLVKDTLETKPPGEEFENSQSILKKRADYYLKNSKGVIQSRKKRGLKLTVIDMVYFKNEVYLVLAIENLSGITFEPDYLDLYVTRGDRKRNASYQRLMQEPIYTHQFPKAIFHQQKQKFVLVFPKFTVGENEKLELELREKKGSRFIEMRLRHLNKKL